jgi:hypothetical protein
VVVAPDGGSSCSVSNSNSNEMPLPGEAMLAEDFSDGETATCCVTWLEGGRAGFRANEVVMVVMMMMMMMMRGEAAYIRTRYDLVLHTRSEGRSIRRRDRRVLRDVA